MRTKSYTVGYAIRSGIDGWTKPVHVGTIPVEATTPARAKVAARKWIEEESTFYDERIDPRITITSVQPA